MIIHLYAQCWNDEWMLPFFFRHYDRLVDRYFIYDDGSTDATMALLQAHPKVEAGRFPRSAPDSFALSEQSFSNRCWKRSRGKADWVIVTDIDEHLFHPRWRDYLSRCTGEGVTMVPALGFQMISEKPPRPGENLCEDHRVGVPWVQMMKASIFNPDAILEINFGAGRHTANPEGTVFVPHTDEMLLFHYKYMGFQQTFQRHQQLRTGLGSLDLQQGWGHKYSWPEETLRADWEEIAGRAFDTTFLRDNPAPNYQIQPWWENYRKRSLAAAAAKIAMRKSRMLSAPPASVAKVWTNLEFLSDAMIDSIEGILAASVTIPGWTSGEDAMQVALTSLGLPGQATIVEVGVFMGRCTVLLAGPRLLRGSGKVHCIDPFDCSGDAFSVPYYVAALQAARSDSLEELFRANISRLGLDSWVEVHKATSREAAARWSQPVDLLLLDGDQSPEGACEAFDAWMSFLRPGGAIILRNTSDREYADGHDGHRRLAVQELVKPQFSAVRQVGATTFAIKNQ